MILLLLMQDLIYVKKETREATRQASVEATLKEAGVVSQSDWKYIGPFDNAGGRGVGRVYPPEEELNFEAEYVGADGKMVRWQDGAKFVDGKGHDLNLFGRLNYSLCYFARTITADRDTDVTLLVGSDDSISVWLNGKKVHDYLQPRGLPINPDVAPVTLKAGANTLLLKVANWEGPTQFSYELTRLSKAVLDELSEKLEADFPSSSEAQFYRIETLATPEFFEVGGLAFTVDGVLMACTRRGEVWALRESKWSLFASGLHEPLGLWPGEKAGELYTVQRPELTRLADTDGDGAADVFECVSDGWGLSGQYHEFAFGPVRDKEGNFYGTLNVAFHNGAVGDAQAPYRGWAFKVTPKGEFVPMACGLRSPNGLAFNPDGELFVTDNQGDFVGTGPLYHVRAGDFLGHPAGLAWEKGFEGDPFEKPLEELDKRRKPAAVLFPFGPMGQSASEPRWCTFGPFEGQGFVGDQTKSSVMRIVLEKVAGEYQGACFPMRSGFQSGNNRIVQAPDGSFYVGQTDRGWGAIGGKPWGVQRLVYTGKLPMEILSMKLTADGFELTLTKPVAAAGDWSIQHYYYNYHKQYGSPQFGVTAVKPTSVTVDGARVRLVLPELVKRRVYEFHVKGLRAADGSELLHGEAYYTLNRLTTDSEY